MVRRRREEEPEFGSFPISAADRVASSGVKAPGGCQGVDSERSLPSTNSRSGPSPLIRRTSHRLGWAVKGPGDGGDKVGVPCLSLAHLALGRIFEPIEATCEPRRANEERRLPPQFGLYVSIPSQFPSVLSASPTMRCKRGSKLGLAASPPPQTVDSSTQLPVPIGVLVRGGRSHGHEDGHTPDPGCGLKVNIPIYIYIHAGRPSLTNLPPTTSLSCRPRSARFFHCENNSEPYLDPRH